MKKLISIIMIVVLFAATLSTSTLGPDSFIRHDITNEQLVEMVENNEISQCVTWMMLSGSEFTDATPLAMLTNLRTLFLIKTSLVNVTPLSRLTSLKVLLLFDNQITDIAPLNSLPNLELLNLDNNQVTDLTPLYTMTNLTGLGLSNNQIIVLTPLYNLTNLQHLNLSDNQITDLTPLYNLTGLQYLDLTNNPITYEQIKALQKELPDLRIYHNAKPTPGHVLGNLDITIFDALEILKYIVGIDNVIDNDAIALEAALIVSDDVPGIFDVLEVLKYLVNMDGVLKQLE